MTKENQELKIKAEAWDIVDKIYNFQVSNQLTNNNKLKKAITIPIYQHYVNFIDDDEVNIFKAIGKVREVEE